MIEALAHNSKAQANHLAPLHVPYRNSKLTRLLSAALGGNAKTAMIVTCSAEPQNHAETLATLRFGSRAACISTRPTVNTFETPSALRVALEDAQQTVIHQQEEIDALRALARDMQLVMRCQGVSYHPTPAILGALRRVEAANVDAKARSRSHLAAEATIGHVDQPAAAVLPPPPLPADAAAATPLDPSREAPTAASVSDSSASAVVPLPVPRTAVDANAVDGVASTLGRRAVLPPSPPEQDSLPSLLPAPPPRPVFIAPPPKHVTAGGCGDMTTDARLLDDADSLSLLATSAAAAASMYQPHGPVSALNDCGPDVLALIVSCLGQDLPSLLACAATCTDLRDAVSAPAVSMWRALHVKRFGEQGYESAREHAAAKVAAAAAAGREGTVLSDRRLYAVAVRRALAERMNEASTTLQGPARGLILRM